MCACRSNTVITCKEYYHPEFAKYLPCRGYFYPQCGKNNVLKLQYQLSPDMELYISTLRKKIGARQCPLHQQIPTIGVYGDDIEVCTCCSEFRRQLEPHIENALDSAGTKVIIAAIKKMFSLPKIPLFRKLQH